MTKPATDLNKNSNAAQAQSVWTLPAQSIKTSFPRTPEESAYT